MLLFNVWDRIEENEFADTVTTGLARLFPADPPLFLVRTPYGYCDPEAISKELADAGFGTTPRFEIVTARSRAASAQVPAIAFCQGTPLRAEIEARHGAGLNEATSASAAAIAAQVGTGTVDGKTQARVIAVQR